MNLHITYLNWTKQNIHFLATARIGIIKGFYLDNTAIVCSRDGHNGLIRIKVPWFHFSLVKLTKYHEGFITFVHHLKAINYHLISGILAMVFFFRLNSLIHFLRVLAHPPELISAQWNTAKKFHTKRFLCINHNYHKHSSHFKWQQIPIYLIDFTIDFVVCHVNTFTHLTWN